MISNISNKYHNLQAIAWQHKLISTIRYELNSLASYYAKCFLHSHKTFIRTFLFLICKCLSITNIFSNAQKTTSVTSFEKKNDCLLVQENILVRDYLLKGLLMDFCSSLSCFHLSFIT